MQYWIGLHAYIKVPRLQGAFKHLLFLLVMKLIEPMLLPV